MRPRRNRSTRISFLGLVVSAAAAVGATIAIAAARNPTPEPQVGAIRYSLSGHWSEVAGSRYFDYTVVERAAAR